MASFGGTFQVMEFAVESVELEQLQTISSAFSCEILQDAELSGFGGWFDVQFNGSAALPTARRRRRREISRAR